MISKIYKFFTSVSVVTVVALAFAIACDDADKDVSGGVTLGTIQTDLGTVQSNLGDIIDNPVPGTDPTTVETLRTIQTNLMPIQTRIGNLQTAEPGEQITQIPTIQNDLMAIRTNLETVQDNLMGEDAATVGTIVNNLETIETNLGNLLTRIRAGLPVIEAEFGIDPNNIPDRARLGLRAAAALGISSAEFGHTEADVVTVPGTARNPVGDVLLSKVDEDGNILSSMLSATLNRDRQDRDGVAGEPGATTPEMLETRDENLTALLDGLFGTGNADTVAAYFNEANKFRFGDQYFRMTLPDAVDSVEIPLDFMYAYVTFNSAAHQNYNSMMPMDYFMDDTGVTGLVTVEHYETYTGDFSALTGTFSDPLTSAACTATDITDKQCFTIDTSGTADELTSLTGNQKVTYVVLRHAQDPESVLDAFQFVFTLDDDDTAETPSSNGMEATGCTGDFCETPTYGPNN